MGLVFKDRVADTSSTTGTGTLTLAGSAPGGYRTFSSAHANSDTVRFVTTNSDQTQWEVAEGVWNSAGNTLTRATVYASSNSGSLVAFSGALVVTEVFTADAASKITHLLDKARAYLGANSATTTGWQKVPFDTIDFDTNSLWDAGNKRFVAKKAGYYQINVLVRMTTAVTSNAGLKINGGSVIIIGTDSSAGANRGGSALVYLAVSDYIEAWLYASSSGTWDGSTGSTSTSFSLVGPL